MFNKKEIKELSKRVTELETLYHKLSSEFISKLDKKMNKLKDSEKDISKQLRDEMLLPVKK